MASVVFSMARVIAIIHIIIGLLLVCFGIADRVVDYGWTGPIGFGIWIGIWVLLTGALGVDGTRKGRTISREAFLKQSGGVLMGFSIVSALFAGVLIACYVPTIVIYQHGYYGYTYHRDEYGQQYRINRTPSGYEEQMAICAVILALGIIELVIGIWSAVCCCVIKCCIATPSQQGQVMVYTVHSSQITPAWDCGPGVMAAKDAPPVQIEVPPPPPYEHGQHAIQNTQA